MDWRAAMPALAAFGTVALLVLYWSVRGRLGLVGLCRECHRDSGDHPIVQRVLEAQCPWCGGDK